jgi:hypothetical protein
MKQEKGYGETLKTAAWQSVTTVLFIALATVFISWGNWLGWILFVLVIASAKISISKWMQGAKEYIDFAIEEKMNQKRESASSPNENVSEA